MKPTAVEIIERNVVLCDLREKYPLSAIVRGDVGLLPNGKLAARWQSVRRDGSSVWATADWPYKRDVRRPLPHQVDWGMQLDTIRENEPHGWNLLAVALKVPRLFETGQVLVPRRHAPGGGALHLSPDAGIDWLPFVHRHAGEGDWGEHGRYKPGILDEVMLWTLHEQPIETLNRVAIAAVGGAVRSRYQLDQEVSKGLRDPIYSALPAYAEILTVVSRAGNRTICYVVT